MASAIETALYGEEWVQRVSPTGDVGEHCVLQLTLADGAISLRVTPWECEHSRWTNAVFAHASLTWFAQTAADPDDLRMPWGIVGFHCSQQDDGKWQFNLNCRHVRWSWTSDWPVIERATCG